MTENQPSVHAPYFFLSYCRSDPLAGNPPPEENPDHLVERFFWDLTNAVRARAAPAAAGFFDQGLTAGSDWKQSITRALSTAQVFVPLYSVGYLRNSWPGREFTCFIQRVEQTGQANPLMRLVPVLWAPLAGVDEPPGLREALGSGAEPYYAQNGLRALLNLSYDREYNAVVDQLAARIVELAERDPIDPIAPSQVPDIATVESKFSLGAPLMIFDIEIAAPTAATVPEGHSHEPYGETALLWRPFPGQELSLAESASQITELFNFQPKVRELRVGRDAARKRPGIIIIDPAMAASKSGQAALTSLAYLPPWVLPLVVSGRPDDPSAELAGLVRQLIKAERLPTDPARRGARGVETMDEFVSLVPVLVAAAERQYLRQPTGRVPSPRSAGRPRLGQSEGPDENTLSTKP